MNPTAPKPSPATDPFGPARRESGRLDCPFQGETVPMILRHADVREAAKDWHRFSSDAPFRVPIPSEEDVRTVRQLPIETDPPDHTEYREIVEPVFRRAKDPAVAARIEALIDGMLAAAHARESVEIVREFALPLQSRALAHLLNVPEQRADIWIGWGTHVFHDGDGHRKGAALEEYLNSEFDRAAAAPGDDFFSALTRATFRGRPLTRAEMLGFANLTFAGGRDTVIHMVSSVIAHLGRHPEALAFLREDPTRIVLACEEFFRVFTPFTHIGRVSHAGTDVLGKAVPAGGRVSLCWASANLDDMVFDTPQEVRLDRKPNPHVAFGFGAHICIGAAHARLILRSLLQSLAARTARIDVLDAAPHIETTERYERAVGFERLVVRLTPL
jgi:cytochrome P450